MQNSQEIALDLPQKFLVSQAGSDEPVLIRYNDPLFIGKRHNIQGQDMLLGNIANALQAFAETGGGID